MRAAEIWKASRETGGPSDKEVSGEDVAVESRLVQVARHYTGQVVAEPAEGPWPVEWWEMRAPA